MIDEPPQQAHHHKAPPLVPVASRFAPLTFEFERYQRMLGASETPNDRHREVLENLWKIVVGFVDDEFKKCGLNNCEENLDDDSNAMLRLADIAKTRTIDAAVRS